MRKKKETTYCSAKIQAPVMAVFLVTADTPNETIPQSNVLVKED